MILTYSLEIGNSSAQMKKILFLLPFQFILNFVKNWFKDFNHLIFAIMKRFYPPIKICKTLCVFTLIAVLVFSSCGLKHSVKHIFNLGNLTEHTLKAGTSCKFVKLTTQQQFKQVAIKKEEFRNTPLPFSDRNLISKSPKTGFRNARSVPLYILHQQLRSFLI